MSSNKNEEPNDPFHGVLGGTRGLGGIAASHDELRAARDELRQTAERLRETEASVQALLAEVGSLQKEVGRLTVERNHARQDAEDARTDEKLERTERDRARYAAMRAGQQDPCGLAMVTPTHQGDWTPGRPYLADQHVWHPETGECYSACSTGAPTREIPGSGRHWERCLDPDYCPTPVLSWAKDTNGRLSGPTLRQTEIRWGPRPGPVLPRQLTDEELTHAIGFLRANASDMCAEERQKDAPLVPCPIVAYPSASAWMADTPLMRALLREQRRRRAATRRLARAPPAAL